MFETMTIPLGALEFDVHVAGPADGIPIVLLHGFPETARSWSAVASGLVAAGHRVIAPDQRGYSPGARPLAVADYALDALAGDVLGILDALEIESTHLVGHDWGSAVAWQVAATHPDRVRSLVAVSVPHPAAMAWAIRNDREQKRKSAYIALFRRPRTAERVLLAFRGTAMRMLFGGHVEKAAVREYLAVLRQPGALTAALNWYRAMTRRFGDLPAVRVPTTHIWSTKDMALGEVGARRCADFVDADYRLVVVEGVSHWVPEEAPQEVIAAILQRVAEATPSTPSEETS